jgi:hypothetical protein
MDLTEPILHVPQLLRTKLWPTETRSVFSYEYNIVKILDIKIGNNVSVHLGAQNDNHLPYINIPHGGVIDQAALRHAMRRGKM